MPKSKPWGSSCLGDAPQHKRPQKHILPFILDKNTKSTDLEHFTMKTGAECHCSCGLAGTKGWEKEKQLRNRFCTPTLTLQPQLPRH